MEEEAVQAAVARHEGALLRYASRLLKDQDQARDVVQETFLRLCREDPARLNGHLTSWLYKVCRNLAIDTLRKSGRVSALDDDAEPPSPEPSPARVLEGEDALRAVLRVVATLPASQQEVLRLKFHDELSYQEISDVTGHSVNHVGVLIHKGLATLRRIR